MASELRAVVTTVDASASDSSQSTLPPSGHLEHHVHVLHAHVAENLVAGPRGGGDRLERRGDGWVRAVENPNGEVVVAERDVGDETRPTSQSSTAARTAPPAAGVSVARTPLSPTTSAQVCGLLCFDRVQCTRMVDRGRLYLDELIDELAKKLASILRPQPGRVPGGVPS